ncbi:MAG: uroporphyrinogen-III C-methyltransferase [Deltaproteobacteria bacterium]|nr:uroporphyrinogen-III C-methyltransferase [Deltaproteobacteria bacterium]
MKGKVYLVGAGPGDPGLITEKGKACIAAADVIIYDYLSSDSLLVHARPGAEKIYAGKKGGDHTLTQDRINALIVEKALSGRTVTRLKGGDPFIFGRGGEEVEAVLEAGISFEIVPGVTSAIAAPAYAGIPLTHRSYASCVTFVTGHEDPKKSDSSLDWQALARTGGTLVFLMGVKNLPNIVSALMENGMRDDTPAALVRWGTTTAQKAVTGTLATIVADVKAAGLTAPCITVIGDVVELRDQMKWFETRPLFGKRIVVTRARSQASDMVAMLSGLGADCIEFPVIKIVPPEDFSEMDSAISSIGQYDWLIFTSVNGVDIFLNRLFEKGKDARALGGLGTAAIGPATAERMRSYGLRTDILPESFRAESVIAAFSGRDISGRRILLPRAAAARPVLVEELVKMGGVVDEIVAYNTVCDGAGADKVIEALENGTVAMVTFTSSSTVTNFLSLLPADRQKTLLEGTLLAAIGPITAKTAADAGLAIDVEAETYTIEGLCRAITDFYRVDS